MSHYLTEDRQASSAVQARMSNGAQATERRRPGRIENASPELIALMRKPNQAARIRVALYDAPGFMVGSEHRRPALTRRGMVHMVMASVGCSAACAVAFKAMLVFWG